MSQERQKRAAAPSKRRYLVQLLRRTDANSDSFRYIARISLWAARSSSRAVTRERAFADECELIAVINPLLARGSDVRDVFEHIESPNGFFYLLRLSIEEAAQLGWRPELTLGNAE